MQKHATKDRLEKYFRDILVQMTDFAMLFGETVRHDASLDSWSVKNCVKIGSSILAGHGKYFLSGTPYPPPSSKRPTKFENTKITYAVWWDWSPTSVRVITKNRCGFYRLSIDLKLLAGFFRLSVSFWRTSYLSDFIHFSGFYAEISSAKNRRASVDPRDSHHAHPWLQYLTWT